MRGQVYGYYRLTLVGGRGSRVEDEMRSAAAGSGCRVERMFVEPAPAVDVLWSLIVGVDTSSGGRLMPAISALAGRRGVDLHHLLDRGRRSTVAIAWQALLSELQRADGASVIVPGPEHLDGLAESRSVLLQQLSSMRPAVRVRCLSDRTSEAPRTEVISALIGEIRFGAALEVTVLKVRWYLSQAGLSYLARDAEAVLRELIGSRISTDPLDELEDMRVRLLRTAHTLVIDVHQAGIRVDEPIPTGVQQRCSSAVRQRAIIGGAVTCCELPLADPGTASLADAVHRYKRIATPPTGVGELQ